jgi:2,4-dienoyl-CoA reductase-like NADH-dependent reductase (Old Yellow Enzyme family)
MKEKYENLFIPITLKNGAEVRNRIVMAPMTTFSGNPDGTVSEQELKYYKRRAQGLGMLITACIGVSPEGIAFPGQFTVFAKNADENLKKLSEIIRNEGTKAILQIHHGGRMALPSLVPEGEVVSASNIASPRTPDVVPRELDEAEIDRIIDDFGKATKKAIDTGFDGVEIHGANTYLIQQFFSPHSNRRTDRWGGDIHNRMLFPMKIIDKVTRVAKEYGKEGFIVGYRVSPEEIETPGIRIEDTLVLVEKLAEKDLDYIHISLQDVWAKPSMGSGYEKSMTEMIVEKVNGKIPVITVGNIHTPDEALKVLDSGVDMAALGRELIMEPDWAEKIKDEKEDKIAVTISHKSKDKLVIPDNLFERLENTDGWFPFED